MTFLIFLISVAVLDRVLFRPEGAKETAAAEEPPSSKAARVAE